MSVYAVTNLAATRARAGLGPTLIWRFTDRAEGHSTSYDPTRYRPGSEPAAWPLGDPIDRLKRHLIQLGAWSEDEHVSLVEELARHVKESGREAEALGTLKEGKRPPVSRSEEHTSELQSLMRISYAVFCLKKNTRVNTQH